MVQQVRPLAAKLEVQSSILGTRMMEAMTNLSTLSSDFHSCALIPAAPHLPPHIQKGDVKHLVLFLKWKDVGSVSLSFLSTPLTCLFPST